MIRNILILVLLLPVIGWSQAVSPKQRNAGMFGTSESDGFQDLWEMPRPNIGGRSGSPYLAESWSKCVVMVKEKLYKFDSAKYDLFSNDLEFTVGGNIRVLDGKYISGFTLGENTVTGQTFVNAASFKFGSTPLVGFIEKIHENGDFSLYRRYFVVIKPPDYNEALQMGNKTERIVQKSELLIGNKRDLHIIKNRKSFSAIYPSKSGQINQYIKKNKINVKEEAGIVQVLDFCSSLE